MPDHFGNDDVARHQADMGPCQNGSTDRASERRCVLRVTTLRRALVRVAGLVHQQRLRGPRRRWDLDIVERSFDNNQALAQRVMQTAPSPSNYETKPLAFVDVEIEAGHGNRPRVPLDQAAGPDNRGHRTVPSRPTWKEMPA